MAKITLGLPYKGSKAAIAEDIVKKLPPGGRILDACCGGGAFSTARRTNTANLWGDSTTMERKRTASCLFSERNVFVIKK